MKAGLLRKVAAGGIAMLMLITLVPSIGQAAGDVTVNVDVEVTITYNANYDGSPGYVRDKHSRGKNYTVKNNSFNRPNYEFECWNTQPDGKGTTYTAEQIIIVNVNIILYAQWRPGSKR